MLPIHLIWSLLSHAPLHDSLPTTDTAVITASRIDFLRQGGWSYKLRNTAENQSITRQLQENGIYLKQYGPIGLATFSTRGADPQQVQVVWNGIPMSNPMAGMTDLNTLGLSSHDQLEVSLGSTAGFYGSGNVGGSLLLNTMEPVKSGVNMYQRSSTYGNFAQGLELAAVKKQLALVSSSGLLAGSNRYPYYGYAGISKNRMLMQNAASQRFFQRNQVSWKNKKVSMRAIAEYTANRREPGLTLSGPAGGTLWDRSLRLLAEIRYRLWKGDLTYRNAYFRDFLRYRDDLSQTDDSSRAGIWNQQLEWVRRFQKLSLLIGADVQHIRAKTEAYPGLILKTYPAQLVAINYQSGKWNFNANSRFEWVEKIPVASAAVQRRFGSYYLRVSAGNSFRRPAMNDLYWLRNGNPNLRSEQGMMAETGLGMNAKHRKLKGSAYVCAYRRQLQHPIIWVANGSYWEAVNLLKGDYKGIQLTTDLKQMFRDSTVLGIHLNGEYVNAMMTMKAGELPKKRIFIPPVSASAILYYQLKHWQFHVNSNYTGMRYATNDNTMSIPEFMLFNAGFQAGFKGGKTWRGTLGCELMNMLNADYHVMPGRPMPLRGFEIQLRLNYQK